MLLPAFSAFSQHFRQHRCSSFSNSNSCRRYLDLQITSLIIFMCVALVSVNDFGLSSALAFDPSILHCVSAGLALAAGISSQICQSSPWSFGHMSCRPSARQAHLFQDLDRQLCLALHSFAQSCCEGFVSQLCCMLRCTVCCAGWYRQSYADVTHVFCTRFVAQERPAWPHLPMYNVCQAVA